MLEKSLFVAGPFLLAKACLFKNREVKAYVYTLLLLQSTTGKRGSKARKGLRWRE